MRVIAGTAKGTRLVALKELRVRPTLDRVREALFSILTPRVEGAHFLDMFAGTGANGIEALSRGAASATFVDNDARSLEMVRRNLDAARLAAKAVVCRLDLPKGLSTLSSLSTRYDIVFADPPYGFARDGPDAYAKLLDALYDARVLTVEAIVVIEHDFRSSLPEKTVHFACARQARYGETALSFFS